MNKNYLKSFTSKYADPAGEVGNDATSDFAANNDTKDDKQLIENNADVNDEADITLSTEEMNLNDNPDDFDIPYYDTSSKLGFDNIKIILATIFGNNGRLKFETENGRIFAVDKRRLSKDNRIFYVNTSYFEDLNPDDIHYSQVVFDHTYENIESYSRLFYTYGILGIAFLTSTLVKINRKGENEPLNPKFESAFNSIYNKVDSIFEDFEKLINNDKSNISIISQNLYLKTMEMHQNIEADVENDNTFGSILASLFTGLTFLLTGLMLSLCKRYGINANLMYDNDTVKDNVKTILNTLIMSNDIDVVEKNRMISMFYLYYKMCNFYTINGDIELTSNKMISALYYIGDDLDKYDKEKFFEYIDTSLLTLEDLGYTYMPLSYFELVNPLTDSANFVNSVPNFEMPQPIAAMYLSNFITTKVDYDEENSPLTSIVEETVDNIKEKEIVDFYNFFLNRIVNRITSKISVKMYYLIAISRSIFLKALNQSNLSKTGKTIAKLGLAEADGYLGFLYKIWKKKDYVFDVSSEVVTFDNRLPIRKLVAMLFIKKISEMTFTDSIYRSGVKDIRIGSTNNPFNDIGYNELFNICPKIITSCCVKSEVIEKTIEDLHINYVNLFGETKESDFVKNLENMMNELTINGVGKNKILIEILKFMIKNNLPSYILKAIASEKLINLKICFKDLKAALELDYSEDYKTKMLNLLNTTDSNMIPIIGSTDTNKLGDIFCNKIDEWFENKDDDFQVLFQGFMRYVVPFLLAKDGYEYNCDDTDIIYKGNIKNINDSINYANMVPIVSPGKEFTFMNIR